LATHKAWFGVAMGRRGLGAGFRTNRSAERGGRRS